MPVDFKKTEKNLYQPNTTPGIVDVPEMVFIAVDGTGDPNTSAAYKSALEILYGLSYAIKMGKTGGSAPDGYFEYVVFPLEGLWQSRGGAPDYQNKNDFYWTSMIRQPAFVTPAVFEGAKTAFTKKKPEIDLSGARLIKTTEGLCVQAMHIGPYDDEPATIASMEAFAAGNGYSMDLNDARRHHEIYLSDPRKTAREKLKTIIRLPVRPVAAGRTN